MIHRRASLALTRVADTTSSARTVTTLPQALRQRMSRAPQRSSPPADDPSSQMFRRIRTRLTLWYSGALAAMLIVGSMLLYFAVQQALLGPIPGYLNGSAQTIAVAWSREMSANGSVLCDGVPGLPGIPIAAVQHVPYVMCYVPDPASQQNGVVAAGSPGVPDDTAPQGGITFKGGGGPDDFYSYDLVSDALSSTSGQATDTIVGEHGVGAVERLAVVVTGYNSAAGGRIVGVVQVGIPIQGSLDALHALLVTLLIIGALTILGAALAGRWLAARAMEPAQISFARQQTFIGDAAHELRTPLTIMRADAEVLLRGRQHLQPDDVELLEDIVSETAHMGALATNLLTLARLDAGRLHVDRNLVDLNDVANAVAHRVNNLAQQRHNTVIVEAQHALTLGDQAQLEQAALILVDNAIKYNRPDGTVTIRVTQDADHAYLTVQDTGIGIPPENLPHLGERFYRVDKARSREAGGAGLGLSIARGIVGAHGGTLTFESALGSGTTASIRLRVAK